MEFYFKINKGSKFEKQYKVYKKESDKFWQFAKKFLDDNNIEANEYGVSGTLMIVPTDKDLENFGKQMRLGKGPESNGAYYFRANSKLNKLWKQGIKDNNINTSLASRDSAMWNYMPHAPRWRSLIIESGDDLYFKYTSDYISAKDFPESEFISIKASEYYMIIEDLENNNKQQEE